MESIATTTLVTGIAFLAVLFLKHESRRKKRKLEAAFAGRETLDAEGFYDKYFKAKGVPPNIVLGVREVLEEQLLADMSRLADIDDFSKNLGFFFEFDSMADIEIVMALEEKFGIKIADDEAADTKTVDDLVRLVWRKAEPQNAP